MLLPRSPWAELLECCWTGPGVYRKENGEKQKLRRRKEEKRLNQSQIAMKGLIKKQWVWTVRGKRLKGRKSSIIFIVSIIAFMFTSKLFLCCSNTSRSEKELLRDNAIALALEVSLVTLQLDTLPTVHM